MSWKRLLRCFFLGILYEEKQMEASCSEDSYLEIVWNVREVDNEFLIEGWVIHMCLRDS